MAEQKIVEAPIDDWSVPKLFLIAFAVLGTFFVFIWNVSP